MARIRSIVGTEYQTGYLGCRRGGGRYRLRLSCRHVEDIRANARSLPVAGGAAAGTALSRRIDRGASGSSCSACLLFVSGLLLLFGQ